MWIAYFKDWLLLSVCWGGRNPAEDNTILYNFLVGMIALISTKIILNSFYILSAYRIIDLLQCRSCINYLICDLGYPSSQRDKYT